jgi:hypothetical protein
MIESVIDRSEPHQPSIESHTELDIIEKLNLITQKQEAKSTVRCSLVMRIENRLS